MSEWVKRELPRSLRPARTLDIVMIWKDGPTAARGAAMGPFVNSICNVREELLEVRRTVEGLLGDNGWMRTLIGGW